MLVISMEEKNYLKLEPILIKQSPKSVVNPMEIPFDLI